MLCPVCHTENVDDAMTCSSCSSSLNIVLGQPPSKPPGFDSFDAPTMPPSSRLSSPAMASGVGRFSAGAPFSAAAAAPSPDFGPRYRVEGKLGEGGMGSVYKAYDLELDRMVALKVIRHELMANAEILQRFKQELLLASRISHKHVLRIHDLGEGAGVKFISMAFIEGRNLAEVMQEKKVLPVHRTVEIGKQICQALAAAHHEGVVHRDLKPQNILLDQAGCVYVSDFGLAKSLEADALAATAMTSAGQVLGTPRYMSPEQVECGHIDGRTDIYSFGLMLYEMVTGDLPFQGNSLQLMLGRVQSMPRNPTLLNAKLPPYLAGIIMRCLEKNTARRYQTFDEVLDDLEDQQATPPGKTPSRGRSRLLSAKHLMVAAAGALCVIVVLALFEYLPVLKGTRILFGNSAGRAGGKRVAVLPFRVVGDDPKLSELALGVSDALNSRLFKVKGITVASSAAAAAVKASDTPEKLGRDLGSNLLVLGTLTGGANDKISFNLKLWDAARNDVSWTNIGDVPGVSGDVLTLEDEIFTEVSKALNVGHDVDPSLVVHPTENVGAYDLYLRATSILRDAKDAEQTQKAIDLYQQAGQADPRFALAFAGLADAQIQMYQKKKDANFASQAVTSAKHAAELNPQLPEVHFSLGSAYSVIGHTVEAIDQINQAIQLMPNSDDGYLRLGKAYSAAGNSTEAIKAFKKAVEINPYYWMNYNRLGVAYTAAGDYESAVEAFRKVTDIEPDNGFGYGNLGNTLLFMGKFHDAVAPLERALRISPTPARNSNLATAYYYLHQYDLSIELFNKAVQLAPDSWMYVGNLGDAYRLAGKREIAAGIYDKAINLGNKDLRVNPRNASTMGGLGLWYARKGDVQQGLRLIADARSIDPNNVDLMYFQAQIAAMANDKPTALAALGAAFKKGLRPAFALAEPDLRSLASDPQFQQLIREYSTAKSSNS